MSVNAQEAQLQPGSNARAEVADLLDSSPQVAKWGTVSLSDITVDGSPMPAVGIDPKHGAARPTLVDGSLPTQGGEVALGRLTKRQLGVDTGDGITARDLDGNPVHLKVVGTVVLPGLGTYPGSDKTSLGEGAVVTQDQLYELGPNLGRDDFVVKFSDSATTHQRQVVLSRAQTIAEQVDPEGFGAEGIQRPSDIVAYDRVRSTPFVLALVLAVLASATVAHALISAVRRRRRDLALLATLGFTRRQISSTVAWQSTTVGMLALLIGVPLGIIGGRWAWGLLADDLGTLSEPRVPIVAIVIGIPVVVLLCNAVAYVPGRIAARTKPAVVLRSE
jgi:ABC-type lipoprotein release transport system permease subunit